jgi:hypothetical protein
VVPPLAESIEDGTLAKFLKSMSTNSVYILFTIVIFSGYWWLNVILFWCMSAGPGDRVNVDEPIAQIETDKVLCWNKLQMFVKDLDGYKRLQLSWFLNNH